MAALGQNFDANMVEPSTPRSEPLPPGDYKAEIVKSDIKPTKNGNGQYLELEMSILEGEHQNRRIFDRLNLINPNATAAKIAAETLSAICRATGQMTVADSEELHFKPMIVRVEVKPSNGAYGPSNGVKGYFKVGSTIPHSVAVTLGKAPPAPTPAATEKSPPWRRAG